MDDTKITTKTTLKTALKLGEECKLSGHCCKFGSGFVLEDEIKDLAKYFKLSEEGFKKKYLDEKESFNTKHFKLKTKKEIINKKMMPFGKCIFLKDNLCSIHKVKPLHCRIGNCSRHGEKLSIWFFLKYFVNNEDPESIRQWAIYLKTHPTIPGGNLDELVPDKNQLEKILNYEIFKEVDFKKRKETKIKKETTKKEQRKNKETTMK